MVLTLQMPLNTAAECGPAGLCASYFASEPSIGTVLDGELRKAQTVQLERNIIVHGTYSFTFPKSGEVGHLIVEGKISGKPVSKEYSLEDLERLYHTMIILAGELDTLFDPRGLSKLLASTDRQKLQALLRHHLSRSTLTMPLSQP